MKTRRQGVRVEYRAIYALLASAGFISSAWAQSQEQTPAILDPVEVTGDRYLSEVSVGSKEAVKPREIPQSISVITKERIEEQGLATVTDALNQVVGVSVQPGDTQTGQFRSRGYPMNLAFDGVPAGALSGLSQLDVAVYERIEVLRGSAGLFQGAGDLGGVVNLVRKRGQKEFAASASVSAGSWDNYNVVADVGGPLNASGSARGRVVASGTDRRYFYDATKTKKFLGYAALDWDLTPATTLSLAFASQKDDTDVPFYGLPARVNGTSTVGQLHSSRGFNPYTDWSKSEWDTQDVSAELSHRFDNDWRVTAKLNHREQDWDMLYGYPGTGAGRFSPDTIRYYRYARKSAYDLDGIDLYASGPFRLFGREHRAVLGYSKEWSSHKRTFYANPSPGSFDVPLGQQNALVPDFAPEPTQAYEDKSRQSGFYGQLRFRVSDPLTVIAGARTSDYYSFAEQWNEKARHHGKVTPYGGVVFDLNRQVSLYASYTDIFAPQAGIPKFDGGIVEPRIGKQYEIGAKGEFFDGQLIASLAVFDRRDENRMYADADHPGYYLAAGEVKSKGWEVEVSGSPAPGWNVQAGYAYQDTEYKKDQTATNEGQPLNFTDPKHTFKLWGTYRFGGGVLDGLTVGLGANHSSKISYGGSYNLAAVKALEQSSYTVANAFLSYRIDKNLTLSFNVNNLFDKTYYARVGSVSASNYYGEPRNYLLTLRATY